MSVTLAPEQMYAALARRDAEFAGAFVVGVKTTGVFCRPGCPARAPKAENCEFFDTAVAAMQAGYRACRRCRPMEPATGTPPWAAKLLAAMDADPSRVLTAADVRRAGAEPATASRWFKSHYGVTVQGASRARRIGVALSTIRAGGAVASAAAKAGFESESGFRKAVQELLGAAPGEAARAGERGGVIVARWFDSPLGPLLGASGESGLCLLEFVDRRALATQLATLRRRLKRPIVPGSSPHLDRLERDLKGYFKDGARPFTVAIEAPGSEFQMHVWDALRAIPAGKTRSYAQIAAAIGRPTAVRAVARANGDNRLAIIIPCHRVIGSDGSLTGYGGGIWRKQWLLRHEGCEDQRGLWSE